MVIEEKWESLPYLRDSYRWNRPNRRQGSPPNRATKQSGRPINIWLLRSAGIKLKKKELELPAHKFGGAVKAKIFGILQYVNWISKETSDPFKFTKFISLNYGLRDTPTRQVFAGVNKQWNDFSFRIT